MSEPRDHLAEARQSLEKGYSLGSEDWLAGFYFRRADTEALIAVAESQSDIAKSLREIVGHLAPVLSLFGPSPDMTLET